MPEIKGQTVAYALCDALMSAAVTGNGQTADVIFENDHYRPGDAPWIEVDWQPGPKTAALDGSVIRESGGLRLMIHGEILDGAVTVNELADAIETRFPPASRFSETSDGTTWVVTVHSVGRGMARRLEAWWRCIVDVNYIAVRADAAA